MQYLADNIVRRKWQLMPALIFHKMLIFYHCVYCVYGFYITHPKPILALQQGILLYSVLIAVNLQSSHL